LALAGMALVAMAHGGSGRMLREGLGLSDRRSGMGGCPFMDPTKTCGPPATDGTRPFCRASARRAWPNWQVLYYKAKVGCLLARFWCDNISVLDRTVEDLGQSKTAQSDSGASSIPAKVSLIYCFFLEDFDVQEARKKAAESRLLLRKFPTPRLTTTEAGPAEGKPSPITPFLVLNAPYLLLKDEKSDLGLPEIPAAKVQTIVKIRENGAGTVRYDVSFRAGLNDIVPNLKTLRKAEFPIGGHSLFERYRSLVRNDLSVLGYKSWDDDDKALACLCPGNPHKKAVFLENPSNPYQRPFPVYLITLDSTQLDDAVQFNFQREGSLKVDQPEAAFFRDLLALLVGLTDPTTADLRFCKQYGLIGEDGRLISLCARIDFLRNISHRAGLCLCSMNITPEVSDKLHVPTLEVAETARVRWYLNGISNFWLDFRIQHARELLHGINSLDPVKQEKTVFEQLEKVLYERVSEGSARLRFFEDSIVHLIGSGALNAMYRQAMDLWRFRDAERLLFEKERALNSLVDQIVDYSRLKQLLAASNERRK
jgi:hypothetical protein